MWRAITRYHWIVLAGTALVFVAISSSHLYYRPFLHDAWRVQMARPMFEFLLLAWMTLLFAWLSLVPRYLRIALMVMLFLPATFFAYVTKVFKQPYTYGFLADIMETNLSEVLSFVSFSAVIALLAFFVITTLLGLLIEKIHPAFPPKKILLVTAPILLVAVNFIPAIYGAFLPWFFAPIHDVGLLKNDSAAMKELSRLEGEKVEAKRIMENSPLVFLHIGESVRADHAPFNGYERNTMPNMLREYDAGNLISFPKCVSFSTSTRLSIIGIMTPAKVLDPVVRGGTFVPFLDSAGIETFGFFSNMPKGGDFYDSTFSRLIKRINHKEFSTKTSDTLMDDVRVTIDNTDDKNVFFLYYGEGSHIPANIYNRDKYSVFTPAATDFEENFRRINAYDNCIVATDDFIGNAIEALRDKNAVYIYVADHGDMLGEDGYWSRSAPFRRKEMRHVLFFVWASEKFQKENAAMWQALCENSTRLDVISHDFVYHSVLGLCGLRNASYDAHYDLFSPEAEPFPTEMPDATKFGVLRFENTAIEWDHKGLERDRIQTKKLLQERESNLNDPTKG